jgi:hypothetical protein
MCAWRTCKLQVTPSKAGGGGSPHKARPVAPDVSRPIPGLTRAKQRARTRPVRVGRLGSASRAHIAPPWRSGGPVVAAERVEAVEGIHAVDSDASTGNNCTTTALGRRNLPFWVVIAHVRYARVPGVQLLLAVATNKPQTITLMEHERLGAQQYAQGGERAPPCFTRPHAVAGSDRGGQYEGDYGRPLRPKPRPGHSRVQRSQGRQ